MAKRTNKTDHVLNLLSSGKKGSESEAERNEQTAPPVEPGPEPEIPAKKAQENSNVSVIHMSDNDKNPIADSVKESLEEELDAFLQQKKGANGVEDTTAQEAAEALPEAEEEMEAPGQEGTEEGEPDIAEPQAVEVAEPPQPEAVEECVDYEIVNVMEYLVRDKAVDYMTQFENCTCPRCIEDTVALTLTHLPSKYVVVSKNAVSPLLNFYEKKYAGQIIVEITKSCMAVKEFPHH